MVAMSVPMEIGHSLTLRLAGFSLSDGWPGDSFIEGVWKAETDELRLTLLQPLQAHTEYAFTVRGVVLPVAGLRGNSSDCQIASEDILLPWTEIQHSSEITGT